MANATEKAIHAAFEGLFGDEPTASQSAPVKRDPLYWRALAIGPDQDDDGVELIERHLALQAEIDAFEISIEKLVAEHADDKRFNERCRKALKARAELAGLQQRELLRDWWPTLRHICLPT